MIREIRRIPQRRKVPGAEDESKQVQNGFPTGLPESRRLRPGVPDDFQPLNAAEHRLARSGMPIQPEFRSWG
jgi:hypothetical protein